MSTSQLGRRQLREILERESREMGVAQNTLTVLSRRKDPYAHGAASHRDGAWCAEQLERVVGPERHVYLRGFHYALVSAGNIRKPDGTIYVNDEANWEWLADNAAKAARWLGFVPFDRIYDNRNAEPVIHRNPKVTPEAIIEAGLGIDIPDLDVEDLGPHVTPEGFNPEQPYALAIFGEKSGLDEVLRPIAKKYEADLYLPSGEISDTLLHSMAKDGAEDGRALIVFVIADCDPAGYQMAVSIGRKLQALRDLLFPDLTFEVMPVALTPEQVKRLDLPSTPLKAKELRGDRWRAAFGIEQTEIDALAQLRPEVLAEIVERAIAPYFDNELSWQVHRARQAWVNDAQERLEQRIGRDRLKAIHERATVCVADLKTMDEEIAAAIGEEIEVSPLNVPQSNLSGAPLGKNALISTDMSWAKATLILKARKAYGERNDEE